jgi:hypothetical protein
LKEGGRIMMPDYWHLLEFFDDQGLIGYDIEYVCIASLDFLGGERSLADDNPDLRGFLRILK